jgi:protein-disulfide isomerase
MTSSNGKRHQPARERATQMALGKARLARVALAGAALLGLIAGQTGCAAEAGASDSVAQVTGESLAGIPQHGTTLGRPDAPITLTEFADLQCPHCRNFAVEALPAILERHVRAGRVRLVARTLTFLGPDSEKAARMAAAVGLQDHLWDFTDLFLRNQGRMNSGYVTDAFLRRIAGSIPGVDVERAMADRDSAAVTAQLEEASRDGDRLGIHGVPAFLLGRTGEEPHRLRVHSMKPEEFTTAIDQLLAERRAAP